MMNAAFSRRRLFALGAGALALPAYPSLLLGTSLRAQQQVPAPESLSSGQLFDPGSLERRDAVVEETANDATAKAAELRLACPCPCTLDIFTCRTTDFTCTFSPERHTEIVALVQGGMGEEQVIDAMVAKYGEEALMAPRAQGFNLVGYVVPAAVVLGVAAVIIAVIALRQRTAPALVPATAQAPGRPSASDEELARLERELQDLES